ncbi:hypothetical protein MIR68_011974 [Amoeboaphelidium protococcarum]|nr:hypothetical protein MIR68_011974 [Amoeboaphelidium protococcarum]
MTSQGEKDEPRVYELQAMTELRFEVGWSQSAITVTLTSGKAEVFGVELPPNNPMQFPPGSITAIYTWHGCILSLSGPQSKVEYIATETVMTQWMQLHIDLESRRRQANDSGLEGPRIIIVGQEDSGKTSLAKTLIAWALKLQHQPILVDLDPKNGTIVMPTCIGAMAVDRMESNTLTQLSLVTSPPLIYHYGEEEFNVTDIEDIKSMFSTIAESVDARAEHDEVVNASGCIIDTQRWTEQLAPLLLSHALDVFRINKVVVIGNERLYSEIGQQLKQSHPVVELIRLPKSGGVVDRDVSYRRKWQMQRVREYFYGNKNVELSPMTTGVGFNDTQVRRYGKVTKQSAPVSALPLGTFDEKSADSQQRQLLQINAGPSLLHSILSVSTMDLPPPVPSNLTLSNDKAEEQAQNELQLLTTNITGFVYVSDVDEKKKKLIVLSPKPGRVPRKYMLMGSLRWAET